MYTPQIEPFHSLDLPESKINRPIINFFRGIVTPYARALKFSEPKMLYPERMISAWKDFSDKKTRLLLGFRHAYGDDAHMMVYLIHHVLPKAARKARVKFSDITHAHFLYGSEVPLWSGAFVRWVLPKAGAIPVGHIQLDAKGMTKIRKMVSNAPYPIALAPEGHVTYRTQVVPNLETGTARFGFWSIEDLAKQDRKEDVVFLPISIHYRYPDSSRKPLSKFVAEMEKICGLPIRRKKLKREELAQRLLAVGISIKDHLISWYSTLHDMGTNVTMQDITHAAISQAEHILRITPPEGERAMQRIYKIRVKAWNFIFRDDLDELDPLGKKLASRSCGEAWFAMRHMELAELLQYVPLDEVSEDTPLDLLWETADNFRDYIERIRGGTLRNRSIRTMRTPIVIPGEVVRINDWAEQYKQDKKGALQAVTETIKTRYETCIKEYLHEFS